MPTLQISPIELTAYSQAAVARYGGVPLETEYDGDPDGTWEIVSALAVPLASSSSPNGWGVSTGAPGTRRWILPGGASTAGNRPWAWDHLTLGITVTPPGGWDVNEGFTVTVHAPDHEYSLDGSIGAPLVAHPLSYSAAFHRLTCSYYIEGADITLGHTAPKNTPVRFVCRNALDPAPIVIGGLFLHATIDPTDPLTPLYPEVIAHYDGGNGTSFYTAYDGNSYPAAIIEYPFIITQEQLARPSVTMTAAIAFDDGTSATNYNNGMVKEPELIHEYATCRPVGMYAPGTDLAGAFVPVLTLVDNYGRTGTFQDYHQGPGRLFTVTNLRPIAAPLACAENSDGTIHLDGSASTDADGDPITYQWHIGRLTARPWQPLTNYSAYFSAVTYNGLIYLCVAGVASETTPDSDPTHWVDVSDGDFSGVDTSSLIGITTGFGNVTGWNSSAIAASGVTADVEPPLIDEVELFGTTYPAVYLFILRTIDNDGASTYGVACYYLVDAEHPINALTDPFGVSYAAIKSGNDIQVIRERGAGYNSREIVSVLEGHSSPSIYRSGGARLFLLGKDSVGAWNLYYSDDCGEIFTFMAQPFGGVTAYKKVRGRGTADGGGIASALKGGTVWITHSFDNVNWTEPEDTQIESTTAADVHQQQAAGSARLVIYASGGTYYSTSAVGAAGSWLPLT